MTATGTVRDRDVDDAPDGLYPDPPEPEHAERAPLPAVVSVVIRVCLALALLAGSLVAYTLWLSALPQARAQEELYGELRTQLAEATAPIGGDIKAGSPVALLEIPALDLRQVVVEGTASGQLWAGPGHRRDTPLPGSPGVSLVYGHGAAFGAPFRNIVWLQPGDAILVTTGLGQFTYRVVEVRRTNDPGPQPLPAGRSRLTLTTAESEGWRTGWAPGEVVYVDTLLDGDPQPGLPGRPGTVATAERAMQGDPDALIPLLLWAELLAAAAIVATWARARWGGVQVWVVGVPVLLAALWGVMDTMAQLLPNLA